MQFIGIKNRYDIIEMSREELVPLVQLMKYISERTIDDMPEPADFDDFGDDKEKYAALKNALEQMDSDNPKTEPCPPAPKDPMNPDWKESVVLEATKDSVTLAVSVIGSLSMHCAHFSTFYRFVSDDDKKLIPDKDTLYNLREECLKMIRAANKAEENKSWNR